MSAEPATDPETKPKRSYPPRRFLSPRGGDADPKGERVVQYYHPSPGVVAKQRRTKKVAARLFAERGLAAVGLNQVSRAANLPAGTTKYYFRNRDDMLTEILYDHVVALTARVGAAHDATAAADPVTRLASFMTTSRMLPRRARRRRCVSLLSFSTPNKALKMVRVFRSAGI